MKHSSKRFLSILLTVMMVISLVPAGVVSASSEKTQQDLAWWNNRILGYLESSEEKMENGEALSDSVVETYDETEAEVANTTTTQSEFLRVYHIDCGRKYFTVDEIKGIIDVLSASYYTHLELAIGNDGLRLILNDMSVTVGNTTYSSETVAEGVKAGNIAYSHSGEWTQSEMDAIIAYADSKNIEIIPLINTPGHMDAIINAMEYVGISNPAYNKSARTVDVTNETAVAFTQALVGKYVAYFAGKGCTYFNMGADEYANDVYTSGAMGFGHLINTGKYDDFAAYVNGVAKIISDADMKPIAFNDALYFDETTSNDGQTIKFNTDIIAAYWTSGWGTYTPASAAYLSNKGHAILNTNDAWYYVLGRDTGTYSYASAQTGVANTPVTDVPGSDDPAPIGAMACTWCDTPSAVWTSSVEGDVAIAASDADTSTNAGKFEYLAETLAENNADYFVADTLDGTADTTTGTVDVTVSVGKTATYTLTGHVGTEDTYTTADGYATYVIDHVTTETVAGTKYTIDKNVSFTAPQDGSFVITNSADIAIVSDGTGISDYDISGDEVSANSVWTIERVSGTNNYTISQVIGETKYYLSYSNYSNNNGLRLSTTSYGWGWSSDNSTLSTSNGNRYLRYNNNAWTTTNNDNNSTELTFYPVSSSVIPGTTTYSTTVTFTGVAVGTTTVTVGDTVYNVTVVAEDLSAVTPLQVEWWITNVPVTSTDANVSPDGSYTSSNKTIYYSELEAQKANGDTGVELKTFVPATGTGNGQTVEFWKATLLPSNNKQTGGAGVDKTSAGTDFTYVRYYNGCWEYSVDRSEWVEIEFDNSDQSDQVVAYYLQKTPITDEITTYVSDWGESYPYSINNYIMIDYAVKYQSGARTPDAFPIIGVTQVFHCTHGDDACARDDSGNYYRNIGYVKPVETAEYEVYMITLTPTSDDPDDILTNNANQNGTSKSNFYGGTEKVVWVDDLANLGEFADENLHYESISGDIKFTAGGEAKIDGLEVYDRHGVLVTYYVRAKSVQNELTVHYIDNANNYEFYTYTIPVKDKTVFSEEFALVSGSKNTLTGNEVVNYFGNTDTVSADLKTMPEISAMYRYSEPTCTNVVRSDDGTEVYLYYTFSPVRQYVIDFGLPIEIEIENITEYEQTETKGKEYHETVNLKYGDVEFVDGVITYTPTQTLKDTEYFTFVIDDDVNVLEKTDTSGVAPLSYFFYIYPASNVMYEETFNENENAFNEVTTENKVAWTATNGTTRVQATEIIGDNSSGTTNEINVHGYDEVYAGDIGHSNGSVYTATFSNFSDTAISTEQALTYTFTGTGFDIISACGTDTAFVTAKLYSVDADGAESLEKVYLCDTYFSGDKNSLITGTGILDYQVPVIRELGLDYGTYKVVINGVVNSISGAISNASTFALSSGSSMVEDVLAAIGLEDYDADDVEVSYMDENSTLNGGTGTSDDTLDYGVSLMSAETQDTGTYYAYVDGIRVYQPLGDPSSEGRTNDTSAGDTAYTSAEREMKYVEAYDLVLESISDTDATANNGLVYMEGDGSVDSDLVIDGYKYRGPENEIYIPNDGAIAFVVTASAKPTIMVSAKSVKGTASLALAQPSTTNGNVVSYTTVATLNTATEMYYNVTENIVTLDETNHKYLVVIANNSGSASVLSLSAIKMSESADFADASEILDLVIKETSKTINGTVPTYSPEVFVASGEVMNGKVYISLLVADDAKTIVVYNADKAVVKTIDLGTSNMSVRIAEVQIENSTDSTYYVAVKDATGNESAVIEITIPTANN